MFFLVRSEETQLCPICKKVPMDYIGRRARTVIDADGVHKRYFVRRLRCLECGHIHHELPDFIVPYKRYAVQIIEAAIEGDTDSLPCYDSTIRSFQSWFACIADKLVRLLDSVNSAASSVQEVSPLEKIKALNGGSAGWLAWAVCTLISKNSWIKATRLLC